MKMNDNSSNYSLENPDPRWAQGTNGPFEVVIGLEVHAQITSKAKLFSGASTKFGADPNENVSLVDAAFPGMLPTINRFCVEQAIKTGLGLNAQINLTSFFDRKNYFYPDLPQGYQISQFTRPIVGQGYLDIEVGQEHETRRINITRLHLEQDAGKSMHDQRPNASHIDLNRAGVALMEIVSEPDIRSIEEAQAYVKKLRTLVRALGTCDGNMEQGNMRADVNISLRRPGEPYGTRAEIKNVNSIRYMGLAIAYEIERQMQILESGGQVDQETRLFDVSQGVTRSMRSKEDAMDYRYFPDPDLPPLVVDPADLEEIKKNLPELPDQKRLRYIRDYDLPAYDAGVLTSDVDYSAFFEEGIKHLTSKDNRSIKLFTNWMTVELFGLLNKTSTKLQDCSIKASKLAGLINLMSDNVISGKIAKTVFADMWESGQDPEAIVETKGLKQVTDTGELEGICSRVLAENAPLVEQFKSGKDKVFGALVGRVMKESQGKANPAAVNEILKKML